LGKSYSQQQQQQLGTTAAAAVYLPSCGQPWGLLVPPTIPAVLNQQLLKVLMKSARPAGMLLEGSSKGADSQRMCLR
jgi:hypothetical protein